MLFNPPCTHLKQNIGKHSKHIRITSKFVTKDNNLLYYTLTVNISTFQYKIIYSMLLDNSFVYLVTDCYCLFRSFSTFYQNIRTMMDTVPEKIEKMEERFYRHEELSILAVKWRINVFTHSITVVHCPPHIGR